MKKFSPVQDLFVCKKPVMCKWLWINADLEMNMKEIFTVMIYTLEWFNTAWMIFMYSQALIHQQLQVGLLA